MGGGARSLAIFLKVVSLCKKDSSLLLLLLNKCKLSYFIGYTYLNLQFSPYWMRFVDSDNQMQQMDPKCLFLFIGPLHFSDTWFGEHQRGDIVQT